jgi:colanic acid/amylovoran biosynthesis glycosyltransferase
MPRGLMFPGPIAYFIAEFPGQTHIWIWREASHMLEWDVDVRFFSTRPPKPEFAARHAFASRIREETFYLWPRRPSSMLRALLWALLTRPMGFWRAAIRALAADGMSMLERAAVFPLLAAACVFAREAQAQGIRHAHLHHAGRTALIAVMARCLIGLPYSLSVNAKLEYWGGGMALKLGDAEFTVVPAKWLFDEIRREHPHLHPSRLLIAPNAVDTRRWMPAERGASESTFRVASVSRLHHGKGHHVLIAAVARLRGSGRNVTLEIIGGGSERVALEALVDRLGLRGLVEFAGSLSEDDVISHLQAADAFALASGHEALGVVYMEAMALGLPTIGTDAGGVGEIITNGHDGLLVPPNDEERLAVAIGRVMDDPALRSRLSANGRKTVVERFDSRLGAAKVYERLFGAPPAEAAASS